MGYNADPAWAGRDWAAPMERLLGRRISFSSKTGSTEDNLVNM